MYCNEVGHQIFIQRTDAIMKTTLEELRLQLQKEINVLVSIVTKLGSVIDNKVNGYQSKPRQSTINTHMVI